MPVVQLVAYTKLAESFLDNREVPLDVDMMPVLAARVSHSQDSRTGEEPAKDLRLMQYLADHKHMSPFEHTTATFYIECPIFVAREMMRHRSISFNEESMRYSGKNIGAYWEPTEYRKQDEKNKQSSSGVIADAENASAIVCQAYAQATKAYYSLIELGVARELARSVIPVGHTTRFYATANLRGWAHYCDLRQSPDAQVEIQQVANKVSEILKGIYPKSWGVLKGL